jgi:hypothetical protein
VLGCRPDPLEEARQVRPSCPSVCGGSCVHRAPVEAARACARSDSDSLRLGR